MRSMMERKANLHASIRGSGKDVLILHGMGCDLRMMEACLEPIFDDLNDLRRVYVDLPGMGRSPALQEASADAVLDALLDFIDYELKGDFLLIGESYGGYLARGILARRPQQVKGMLLLCPVLEPEREKRSLPEGRLRLVDDDADGEGLPGFLQYAVRINREICRRYAREVLPGAKLADEGFILRLKERYAFSFPIRQRFEGPVLLLCGRQDACVGYADALALLEDYPRASVAVLDAAGHNLQLEQPDLLAALTREWLFRTGAY